MNDLDLSSLSTGPAPALAPASDIRARGRQRTQRGRVLVAGAAALVVAAGAGTAVALAGAGKPDALVPAGPTPTAHSVPVGAQLAGALLQPSDAAAVLGGHWFTGNALTASAEDLLEVCQEGGTPISSGLNNVLLDGRGGTLFTQVVRFAPGEALAYMDSLPMKASRCPSTVVPKPDDGENLAPRDTVMPLDRRDSFGLKQVLRDCTETCADQTAYWVVVRVGDLVGLTNTDDPTTMTAWADRVRARLASCGTTCPPQEQLHPSGFPQDVQARPGDAVWIVPLASQELSETVGQATEHAQLVGYQPTTTPMSCLAGYPARAGSTSTDTVTFVAFFTEPKARAFRQRYASTTGGLPGDPVEVTVSCLS